MKKNINKVSGCKDGLVIMSLTGVHGACLSRPQNSFFMVCMFLFPGWRKDFSNIGSEVDQGVKFMISQK